PDGPSHATAFRLVYDAGKTFALAGGFNASGAALGNNGTIDFYQDGIWSQQDTELTDITDLISINEQQYISSFGKGLLQQGQSAAVIFDDTNSPLENRNISALEASDRGLWVLNYAVTNSLHLLKSDNTWQSFALNDPASYGTDMIVDGAGSVSMIIEPSRGGGITVFDPTDNSETYLTATIGNGGLPSNAVRSIATDRDGNVWVGTDAGIAYFFSPEQDAVKPIFEGRFLLKDEKITAIEVDGGNRK